MNKIKHDKILKAYLDYFEAEDNFREILRVEAQNINELELLKIKREALRIFIDKKK